MTRMNGTRMKGIWTLRLARGAAVWLAAVLLTACSRDTSLQHLTLTGSSTVAPLASEIARRYETQSPGVRIDVQAGGSSRGIADARAGTADIGMASRALKADEADDLVAHTIARDGVAIILHAANSVAGLTDDQVRDIYRGRIADWQALGGPALPITVVNKAEGHSTLELFLAHFGLASTAIRASVVIGDNEQGIKTVAGNPGAIGYVSIGAAQRAAAAGVPIRPLPLNGVPATAQAVRQGRFPLSRPLNLVSRGTPRDEAARFIGYAQSAAVHDLVESFGFVPVD